MTTRTSDRRQRRAAGALLVDEAVTPLGMLLDDRETEVQLAAIEALGEIGGEEAERILTRLQRETPDPEIREGALGALAQSQLLSVPIRDDGPAEPDFSDGGFDGPSNLTIRAAPRSPPTAAVAAGGVIYRLGELGTEIVLVARRHEQLWALPKGTPEPERDDRGDRAARGARGDRVGGGDRGSPRNGALLVHQPQRWAR